MNATKFLGYLFLAIVLGWMAIWGFLGGKAASESAQLERFCTQFKSGTALVQFQAAARNDGYPVYDRTNLPKTENKESRVAARLLAGESEGDAPVPAQMSVIVLKPGIGFIACRVHHDGMSLSKVDFIPND